MCGRRPEAVARVFLPLDELRRRDAMFDLLCDRDPNAMLQMVVMLHDSKDNPRIKHPYVRTTTAYACSQHLPDLERAAAKSPSWALVEINRGPDPTNRVSVGGGL